MYTSSPELDLISGFAKPLANVTPSRVEAYAVLTLTDTDVPASVIALEASEANALTTPLSVCDSGDWKYLRTPVVVLEASSFH